MKTIKFMTAVIWIVANFIILFKIEEKTSEIFIFIIFSSITGLSLIIFYSNIKRYYSTILVKNRLKTGVSIDKLQTEINQKVRFDIRDFSVREDCDFELKEEVVITEKKEIENDILNVKPFSLTQNKELKKIGYNPSTIFSQENPYSYPVVKMPMVGSIIKLPRKGRTNKLGFTENKFYIDLKKYFEQNFKIYNDRHIIHRTGTNFYEPDFLIISEKDNKNIFIDIEIDEPYDGLSRVPTHELNRDNFRDNFFTKRGYIVIRFTEKQIFEEPIQCCVYIAEIIKSIDPSYVNVKLNSANKISIYEQWDNLRSKKWAIEKYREKYLGISNFGIREFNKYEFPIEDSLLDELVEAEINDLNLIKTVNYDNIPLRGNNPHSRDKRIIFDAINHIYYIDGNPDTISVSQLINKFFPEFDSFSAATKLKPSNELYGLPVETIIKKWNDKGLEAAALGTKLHLQIENYYKNFPNENSSIEYEYFLKFKEKYSTMVPHRTEWRIFDEDYLIAGTIDMIYKKDDGSYYMFDWKRSEKVVNTDGTIKTSDPSHHFTRHAYGDLNHLTDDSYYKYALQQNIYCYILERKYGYKISSLNLLILHPSYENFHWLKLPNMKKEVEYMFSTLKIIS